jgi:hypothetical protein
MSSKQPSLTTKQVMAIAGVSHMTVYVWRGGSATKEPLPAWQGSRVGSVEFNPHQLKSWAKKHGVELKHDPVEVANGTVKLKLPTAEQKKSKQAKGAKKRTHH